MATYSTSAVCAGMGGVRNFGASSRPTETQVDYYREHVYSEIGKIIGVGTADINNVARKVERRRVTSMIFSFLENGMIADELWELSPKDINDLAATFGGGYKILTFTPDNNVDVDG